MVKLLDPTSVDAEVEALDEVLSPDEEAVAARRFVFDPTTQVGDLSDGGMVGGARVWAGNDKKAKTGRPAARLAWSWNGTETVLPLAWNPEGKRHDGGRHYLLKRHCLCCRNTGFSGRQCPDCAKKNCAQCHGSTDTVTSHLLENGKNVKGWIIPAFYLSKENVPFPARFYGAIPCFLPFCPRTGDRGFLSEEEMRIHAASRHKMEYRAFLEAQAMRRQDETADLRKRIDDLTMELLRLRSNVAVSDNPPPQLLAVSSSSPSAPVATHSIEATAAAPVDSPVPDRMAKARAARKQSGGRRRIAKG